MNPGQFLRQLFASADLSGSKKPFWISVIRILLATLLGIGLTLLNVDYVESYLYDLRVRLHPASAPSPHIEIILTDSLTTKDFGGPATLQHYTQALQVLRDSQPRFMVFTLELKKLKSSDEEKLKFVELSKNFFNFFQASGEATAPSEIKLPPPFDSLKIAEAPKTHDKNIGARDGVTRRMIIHFEGRDTIYPMAAKTYNPDIVALERIRGVFNFFESHQAYINFKPPGAFSKTKLEDLLSGKVSPEKFKDKIVLFGDDLGDSFDEYILTPYSRDPLAMTKVEMNANMLDTLIQNSAPIRAPNWINILLTILISILTVHVVLTLKPLRGIMLLLSTAISLMLMAYFLFWPFGIWIQITHPLLAIFMCYYFFIPYRLIIENRRSWEYFQKHKLLSEVELLKTNFIGMMSHDLKTPLARIQGMTEIIVRDKNPLTSNQQECLDTIRQSSEDLTKFISTILNYARIESQGIELHLKNKDPNQLIAEVVKKHEFLARLKQIQLITELEPLFTIQIDPDLICQVISNLIENAIKYSPERSKVLITTEDAGDKILIQISDQGMGLPSDELENIFSKFYRSKNAKSSPIKGSGLGLYLSRYFVELHQGKISVESSEGQGSTFTVELPVSPR